jgi:diguanylate cyclase (GGDEF)-like protein/PAS domain S-box-containing protein
MRGGRPDTCVAPCNSAAAQHAIDGLPSRAGVGHTGGRPAMGWAGVPEFFVEIREGAGLVVDDRPAAPGLLDDAPVPLFLFDAVDREIRHVNRAFAELAGRERDELVGCRVDDLLRPADPLLTGPGDPAEQDGPATDELAARGLTGEFVLHRPDGARRHVEARTTGVEYDGMVCGQVALWDVTDRVAWEQQLLHRASHDTLTGLPNAWYASVYLHRELRKSDAAARQQMAVLFVDLDGFKQINDTFGHQVGDVVLRQTATRLKAAVSVADLTARLHGDEFLVLCKVANSIHAAHLAQRIRRSLGLPIRVGRHTVRVTASVGIAVSNGGPASADRLLRFADHRMYAEKRHPASGGPRPERTAS